MLLVQSNLTVKRIYFSFFNAVSNRSKKCSIVAVYYTRFGLLCFSRIFSPFIMSFKFKKLKVTKRVNTLDHYYDKKTPKNNYYEDLEHSIAERK